MSCLQDIISGIKIDDKFVTEFTIEILYKYEF